MTHEEAIDVVFDALQQAERKHPGFPKDPVHAAGVVGEEAGSLMKAALDWTYLRGQKEHMITEASHVAAVAIRFLLDYHVMESRASVQI